jgi:hypothetical protein
VDYKNKFIVPELNIYEFPVELKSFFQLWKFIQHNIRRIHQYIFQILIDKLDIYILYKLNNYIFRKLNS